MSGRRVALVLGTSTGGIGAHVASLTRGLLARGDWVTVIGPVGTDRRFGFRAAGARFVPVDIPTVAQPARHIRAAGVLRRVLRGAGGRLPEVIHAHGLRAGALARLARPAGVPLAVTFHNYLDVSGTEFRARVLAEGEKSVIRGADVCLCADQDQVGPLVSKGGGDVRYAPVAAPLPQPTGRSAADVKHELGVAGPLVLSVGRLAAVKRHDLLIAAAAGWNDLDPRPVAAIAGDGPESETLSVRVETTGAPIRLLGHRDDIADLLTAADVAVVTSDSETRQFYAQQALHAGVPLVTTKVGGMANLVGEAAELVEPGDATALGAAIRRLLSERQRRDELAEAGAKQAASWPTEADTIDQLDALYRELAGR